MDLKVNNKCNNVVKLFSFIPIYMVNGQMQNSGIAELHLKIRTTKSTLKNIQTWRDTILSSPIYLSIANRNIRKQLRMHLTIHPLLILLLFALLVISSGFI